MAVRSTMNALISRTRLLISDPAGSSQVFADQDIQDVLDESREDIKNLAMIPKATYSGATLSYLDYYTKLTNWEDDYTLKQYLTVPVTASSAEPIAGHWTFASNTFPDVYITGKSYDIYRAAADLLERWAAKLELRFDFTTDGQSFRVSQMADALQKLAETYRKKQRARSISMTRNDINVTNTSEKMSPGPHDLDYFSSGQAS